KMSSVRLLKLLYIADREHLKKAGRPIIGDQPVAMKNGPLHSAVYDLVRGTHRAEDVWSRYIHKDRYEVEHVVDPGVSELSRSEIETLNAVSDRYTNYGEWELVDLTHKFSEWIATYQENMARPIPLESILDAIGFEGDDKALILEELRESL